MQLEHMDSTDMHMRIWASNTSLSTRTFYSSLVSHTTPQSRFDRPSLHPIDSSVQPLVNILIIRGTDHSQPPLKKVLSYPPFSQAFDSSKWNSGVSTAEGGSPYRGLARMGTREACPGVSVGLLGMSLSLRLGSGSSPLDGGNCVWSLCALVTLQ